MMNFLAIFLLASLAASASVHHIIITPDTEGYRVIEVIAIPNASGVISIEVPENAVLMSNGTLTDGVLKVNASENVTKIVYGYKIGGYFQKTFQLPTKLVYILIDPSVYVVSENLSDAGIQNVFGSEFRVLYSENVPSGYTVSLEMSRTSSFTSHPNNAESSGNTYIFAGFLGAVGAVALSAVYLKKIRRGMNDDETEAGTENVESEDSKKGKKWEVG